MELHEHLGKDALYIISVEDAQIIAKRVVGRELTKDELNKVKKGIEWGLEGWTTIVRTAIENAVRF